MLGADLQFPALFYCVYYVRDICWREVFIVVVGETFNAIGVVCNAISTYQGIEPLSG